MHPFRATYAEVLGLNLILQGVSSSVCPAISLMVASGQTVPLPKSMVPETKEMRKFPGFFTLENILCLRDIHIYFVKSVSQTEPYLQLRSMKETHLGEKQLCQYSWFKIVASIASRLGNDVDDIHIDTY
jgi:hypothetical protein